MQTIRDDGREDDLRRELGEPEGRSGDRRARPATKVGKELWADSLGPEGSDGATYIGSIEANTSALVEGFTGEPGELPRRCLTSPRPTSSAAIARCCCWP